ncbi:hypothetical protein OH492_23330 [Vibrio chagasii]|nr:hypothetical protein [Vibrio chagasii]
MPFNKFHGVDPLLGLKCSTGEVTWVLGTNVPVRNYSKVELI